jgi:hypothetical protein
MKTRRGFLSVLAGAAAGAVVVANAKPSLPQLRIEVGPKRNATDARVWLNGVECGGAIPASYARPFLAARVGDVLEFEMFERDERGRYVVDRAAGRLRTLWFRAIVAQIDPGPGATDNAEQRASNLASYQLRRFAEA